VYFYELHESDDDLFSDALLTHDQEFTVEEFFGLVQEARHRVQDTFEEDTLVEGIARELERSHGFTYVSDHLLVAAVNVSRIEDENFIAEVDADGDDGEEDEDGYEARSGADAYRTMIVDLDRQRPN